MKKLWISFAVVLLVSFSILAWIGTRIYQEMPPIWGRGGYLRWVRVPGDTIFAVGAIVLVAFVFTHRRAKKTAMDIGAVPVPSGD